MPKILTVCSTLDFINFTRRATIEAIQKINPDLDILLFNSIKNFWKEKKYNTQINTFLYHFWILEKFRHLPFLSFTEHSLRKHKWKNFFEQYDTIFLTDPNQYYLLPYLKDQQIIYLLRDPSVLQDYRNYKKELTIINKADVILGISKNLCTYYFKKYYDYIPDKVFYWPNTVDLELWDYEKYKHLDNAKEKPIIGLAGNINYVNDLELLHYIANNNPGLQFEIAGKVNLQPGPLKFFQELIKKQNVTYKGFIPYQEFPKTVVQWDVGIVAAKLDHEYAKYLNNNKQYQYLALGKPFITYNLNGDYQEFEDMVFVVKNKEEFSETIPYAIKKSESKKSITKGIRIAQKNSSEIRAKEFLEIINKN